MVTQNLARASHVGDVVGDGVERRVPVDLVVRRREQRVLLIGARRCDGIGAHRPDADPLVATGVDVACMAQRHLVVGGVQRPDVHVVEPPLAAHEDLVERPLVADLGHRSPPWSGTSVVERRASASVSEPLARFLANAVAASLTQAPSSWAWRRCAIRWALHGPCPFTTRANSAQSGWPKSWWPRSSFHRRSGSGSVTPSALACGTVMSTNFCRRSSLVSRLMPQAIDCSVFGESASGGPNIISAGHQNRSTDSCTSSRCSSVPRIIVARSS